MLDGRHLTAAQVVAGARPGASGAYETVLLDAEARERLAATRAFIDSSWMRDDAPLVYAFNTGVGSFKDARIPVADMAEYQRRLILAHAAGVGEPLTEDVVRATMILRANAFASNHSGARVLVLDRLVAFLNAGLHPVIPERGSVGASGDLAPLAHLAGALCGFPEAETVYRGRRMPAAAAAAEAGLDPTFTLEAKDASALINGSTVSLALAVLAAHDARRILRHADVALALSLESMRGERAAFDPRLHRARPHPGQVLSAENVMRLTEGTKRCSEEARLTHYPEESRPPGSAPSPRIHDVYSLRCAAQVHGPARDALGYIDRVISTEINAATDNPLLFTESDGSHVVLSGGHFHGQYVAQVSDLLGMALADVGSISERRLARLIDPAMSYGLPRNLVTGQRGLNTGYATVQCSMSALVMENRHLAAPGSVDSVPGKSNAEDHVSNSTWCARKARTIVENVEQIVACEILMACQALSLVEDLAREHPLGRGTEAALRAVRRVIAPALQGDRWYASEMAAALALVRSGAILEAVEDAVGPLA